MSINEIPKASKVASLDDYLEQGVQQIYDDYLDSDSKSEQDTFIHQSTQPIQESVDDSSEENNDDVIKLGWQLETKDPSEVFKHLNKEEQEIYDQLIMPVDTNIKLSDVILSPSNLEDVNTFLTEQEHADEFISYGLQPLNRLLFYGASGCGKTFLGKALSNTLGYKMLYVDIAAALDSGNAAENLNNIFRLGRYGKCVIFLDECDSIAWNRDADSNDSGSIRRATNSLFQCMDQMNPRSVVISATNMIHRLDPAFERRFNLKMKFERPSVDIAENVIKFLLPQFNLVDDCDATQKQIILNRANISFFEIQGIVERAMKMAIINKTTTIYLSDILRMITKTMHLKIELKTDKDDPAIFKTPVDSNN